MHFEERINAHYNKLNETDIHIVKAILNSKIIWQDLTLQDLADLSDSSTASVVRMLQKLGYAGFSEFKYSMNQKKESQADRPKHYDDFILKSIQHTLENIDQQKLNELFPKIDEAKSLYAYGTGWKQAEALQSFSNDWMYYDRPITILHTFSDINMAYLKMQEGDVFFIVSLSGNTEGMKEIIRFLKLKNVLVVSITSEGQNEIASEADFRFYFADDSYFGLASRHWPALSLKALLDYIIHAYISYLE